MKINRTLESLRILLVECNEWVRDSLSFAFERTGCDIIAVDSVGKAVKAIRKEQFDIIVCDFNLPEYSGLDFFKLKDTFEKTCMKILISTEVTKNMINESKAGGVHEVIEKPFEFKKILQAIKAGIKL